MSPEPFADGSFGSFGNIPPDRASRGMSYRASALTGILKSNRNLILRRSVGTEIQLTNL